MKKDDEGGLILTEKYNLSQASGICGVSEVEALVCGKSTTESLRSLFFQAGNILRKSTLFDVRTKERFASFIAQDNSNYLLRRSHHNLAVPEREGGPR